MEYLHTTPSHKIFEECKKCKACCKDWKNRKLKIPLTIIDKKNLGVEDDFIISINGKCPYLGEDGCILDFKKRPILCKIFPFMPPSDYADEFGFDRRCPIRKKWMAELVKNDKQ